MDRGLLAGWRGLARGAGALLAVLGVLGPVGAVQAAAALPTQAVGMAQLNSAAVPLWVAREQGLFAKHGLAVEVVLFRGGTQAMQAFLAGQVPVLVAGSAEALSVAAQGADVVQIATVRPKMPYSLVVRPEVRRVEDLRGRAVGVSGSGLSASRLGVLVALRHFGLDPRRDGIALVPTGTPAERMAALAAGSIYGAVLDTVPYARIAQQRGLRVLLDMAEGGIPWIQTALHTSRRYMSANRARVEAVLKGLLEANAFILNPDNRATVVQVITRNLRVEQPEAEQTYEDVVSFVARKPYPSKQALQAMVEAGLDTLPDLARIDLDRFVDTSILEQLDRSGFIDGLYTAGTG